MASDHIELLKHLSLTHRDHYKSRRTTEWQCFFTALGFFILSVGAIYKGDARLSTWAAIVFQCFIGALAIATGAFLMTLNMASNRDKELAERAEDALRSTIDGTTPTPNSLLRFEKYCWSWKHMRECRKGLWGSLWQAFAVALFAVGSIILIQLRP